jgi:S1-C subfamily serine protease
MIFHRIAAARCWIDTGCWSCSKVDSCMTTDGPIWPGCSGGPFFNGKGELVGMMIAYRKGRNGPVSGTFITISTLRPLLKKYMD